LRAPTLPKLNTFNGKGVAGITELYKYVIQVSPYRDINIKLRFARPRRWIQRLKFGPSSVHSSQGSAGWRYPNALSLLRLATIESIGRKKNLADLAPEPIVHRSRQ
jgi:hypothetical protein